METQSESQLKVSNLVSQLVGILDCSQKTLCSFLGVTETTLSTSMKKPFSELKDNKVAKRLMSLLFVVETLKRDQSLTAPAIIKVLSTPCYKLEDGTFLDVISAIHEGTNRHEFLVTVADSALKMFRSKYEAEKQPIENGLYRRALSEGLRAR
jgi:hypothetical protein